GADLRDHRGDQQAGDDDPAGRAERQLRTRGLEARIRARDRRDRALRQLGCAAGEPRRSEGVPGRMTVIALLGAKALYLTYAWLGSAIVGAWLSYCKGYGEKLGLAAGLLFNVIGVLLWIIWP